MTVKATAEPRAYTVPQILEKLGDMPVTTFRDLRRQGKMPFLEEILPRLGKHPRYRSDLVDRYLAGEWRRPQIVRSA